MATINKEIHVEETYTELLAKINKSVYAKFPLIEVTVKSFKYIKPLGDDEYLTEQVKKVKSININSINTIEE